MLGEGTVDGAPRFVLCEINVSSVSPFPPSSIAPLVEAVRRRVSLPAGSQSWSFDAKPFLHLSNAAELNPGNASRTYLEVERE